VVILVSNFHHRKGGAPVKEVTAISDIIVGCSTFALSGSNVKAIDSSGYSIDPVMSHYEEYGFCGVVEKPYNLQKLGETWMKAR
jgi:hypothetical protein